METKELLKKYGFVMIIGLALLIFVGVYIADSAGKRETYIDTKQVDGRYVLYSVDGQDYFADDLYDTLYQGAGSTTEVKALGHNVIDKAVKATSDMEQYAASYAAYLLQYYDEPTILNYLRQEGYHSLDDLQDMYLYSLKQGEFISDYYTAHYDEYVKDVAEAEDPRIISHILVKLADVEETTDEDGNTIHIAHPTEEESKKIEEILKELETREFSDVAAQYSDDGSASNGGKLGLVTKTNASKYVKEFADTSLALKPGEMSEVITTTYGYHIILAEEATTEDLLADSDFLQQIDTAHPEAFTTALKEAADAQGVKIYSEDLLAALTPSTTESEAN